MATIEEKIYEKIPDGWKILSGATCHPQGLQWIHNGKSIFDKERRIALWRPPCKD